MGAVNMSRALDQWAATHPVDVESRKSGARRDNIGNGILRSDFVKADCFRRYAVNCSLGYRDPMENSQCPLLHFRCEDALFQQGYDFGMGATVSVVMRKRRLKTED